MVKFKGWGQQDLTEYWGFESNRDWSTLNMRLQRYLYHLHMVAGSHEFATLHGHDEYPINHKHDAECDETFWAALELRDFLKALEKAEKRIGYQAGFFRWLRKIPDDSGLFFYAAKFVDTLWT